MLSPNQTGGFLLGTLLACSSKLHVRSWCCDICDITSVEPFFITVYVIKLVPGYWV